MPLVLNALFGAVTAFVFGRFAAIIEMPVDWKFAHATRLAIAGLLVLATNLVGLAFTGLEHTLQVMIAMVVAWSLLVYARGADLPLWLLALAALGPSVRYEMFAITAGVCVVLAMERRWRDIEIVIHMAAQPLVRYSYQNPVETYSTNVMGTVHLLEAVRNTPGVKAVVNITTDKCYENQEWMWAYRENEPMGGFDPYSSSKGCSELVTAAYRRSFLEPAGIALASARAGNVIGGGKGKVA